MIGPIGFDLLPGLVMSFLFGAGSKKFSRGISQLTVEIQYSSPPQTLKPKS